MKSDAVAKAKLDKAIEIANTISKQLQADIKKDKIEILQLQTEIAKIDNKPINIGASLRYIGCRLQLITRGIPSYKDNKEVDTMKERFEYQINTIQISIKAHELTLNKITNNRPMFLSIATDPAKNQFITATQEISETKTESNYKLLFSAIDTITQLEAEIKKCDKDILHAKARKAKYEYSPCTSFKVEPIYYITSKINDKWCSYRINHEQSTCTKEDPNECKEEIQHLKGQKSSLKANLNAIKKARSEFQTSGSEHAKNKLKYAVLEGKTATTLPPQEEINNLGQIELDDNEILRIPSYHRPAASLKGQEVTTTDPDASISTVQQESSNNNATKVESHKSKGLQG